MLGSELEGFVPVRFKYGCRLLIYTPLIVFEVQAFRIVGFAEL